MSFWTIARLSALLAALSWASVTPVAAEPVPDDDAPTTVQVTFAGYTLTPDLTEAGHPVLDDDGAPVMIRVPLEDSVITPGDQVLYVITLANPTPEPATDLSVIAQMPAPLLLDPFSITGATAVTLDWADEEDPTDFRPVFEEIDGQETLTADLDTLRALRLTLPGLLPAEEISIDYIATLR